jgi:hypothetical protein
MHGPETMRNEAKATFRRPAADRLCGKAARVSAADKARPSTTHLPTQARPVIGAHHYGPRAHPARASHGTLWSVDQATIDRFRTTKQYRVVVIAVRAYPTSSVALGLLVGLTAVEVLPSGAAKLAVIPFLTAVLGFAVAYRLQYPHLRKSYDEASRRGDGYQIGYQGTYYKLLLLDAITGFRAERR